MIVSWAVYQSQLFTNVDYNLYHRRQVDMSSKGRIGKSLYSHPGLKQDHLVKIRPDDGPLHSTSSNVSQYGYTGRTERRPPTLRPSTPKPLFTAQSLSLRLTIYLFSSPYLRLKLESIHWNTFNVIVRMWPFWIDRVPQPHSVLTDSSLSVQDNIGPQERRASEANTGTTIRRRSVGGPVDR